MPVRHDSLRLDATYRDIQVRNCLLVVLLVLPAVMYPCLADPLCKQSSLTTAFTSSSLHDDNTKTRPARQSSRCVSRQEVVHIEEVKTFLVFACYRKKDTRGANQELVRDWVQRTESLQCRTLIAAARNKHPTKLLPRQRFELRHPFFFLPFLRTCVFLASVPNSAQPINFCHRKKTAFLTAAFPPLFLALTISH